VADNARVSFVGVLGPLVVHAADGSEVKLGSRRQRRLLSALVLHAGAVAERDRLIELVFDGALPADPANALQTNIARLRRVLPAPFEIVTEPAGYRLVATAPDVVDVRLFDRLVGAADTAAAGRRLELLDQALALWRGRPYPELDDPSVGVDQARLEELRSVAVERRAEALLATGRAEVAVTELEGLLAAEPLRERAVGLLMRALVAAGRQSDALQAFARLRSVLADDLGLDPSAELRELEGRVLRQQVVESPAVTPGSRPRLPVSSFVGRDRELADVVSALRTDRVVTLTGPGGVGKSRLALHAAHAAADDYADGVAVVDLAPLHRPEQVEQALAAAVGLAGPADHDHLGERVVEVLALRGELLLLDNCEHLADAVASLVEAVTTGAPGVDVLITSREALRVDGERVRPVEPLAPAAAVALLAERIRAADPSVAASEADEDLFAQVCARLDRLPLALELAAARVPAVGLRGLLDVLDAPLEALRQGRRTAAPRHRSLLDVVAWSYGLLTDEQRVLFVRLATFAGAVEAAAVEAVCQDARALPDLVERSLVIRVDGPPTTFGMLETLRAFGRGRLAAATDTTSEFAGEFAALRTRHADWAVRLAGDLGRQRWTAEEPVAIRRFDVHLPDLRRAHEWLCQTDRSADALRLGLLFAEHAYLRGRVDLAALVDTTLDTVGEAAEPLLARLLGAAARYSWQRGDLAGAERRCRRAITLADRLGTPSVAADAYESLGNVAAFRGDLPGALRDIRGAKELAVDTDDAWGRLEVLASLTTFAGYAGDDPASAAAERELADLAERLGAPTALAWAAYAAGERRAERSPAAAVPYLERALRHAEAVDSAFIAGVARHTLLTTAARTGDPAAALPRFGPLLDHWYGLGAWTQLWIALRALTEVLSRRGRHREVAVLLGAHRASRRAAPVYGGDAERLAVAGSAARTALGAEFEVAFAEGAAMGDVEAVALARRLARAG
jgi:predicted ATPase/DNA-binding SARP family transcriptional activator